MQLKDFFTFKDLVRTAFLGSALFLLVGSMYSIFLHAQYAAQVDDVKQDLDALVELMESQSRSAFEQRDSEGAREFKRISQRAKELSKMIQAPPVTPNSYTYFNYWISSAAFTELHLSPRILGLPDKTIAAFAALSTEEVLGQEGWWNHPRFRGFSLVAQEYVQYLPGEPVLQTNFWTFYIFVFLISIVTIFFGSKEEYEFPLLPEIIYGAFMPTLFFLVFTLMSLVSLTGIIQFLDPSQIDLQVSMIAFVIMSVLSASGALLTAFVKGKLKRSLTA